MGSTSNSGLQPQLPKLTGRNYHHWSIQMKVLYESQDLWSIVKNGFDESVNQDALTGQQLTEFKEIVKKDRKALFFIYQTVDEVIFERISSSTSSKQAWDMLYRTYRGEERVKVVRLQTLRCEFDNLRMKETELIEEYYNRVILLLNQMRLNGETIEDRRVIEKIMRSLTKKFEYIVVAIEEYKDLSTMSLENLLGTLQSHELRMRQFDSSTSEHAFQLQGATQENSIREHKENQAETTYKGKGRGRPSPQIQCYHCQKFGHTARFCRKRIAEERGSNFMHREENTDEDDTMFMMLSIQETSPNEVWYLDCGCSNHMTGNKQLFSSMGEFPKKEVRTGDDKRLNVQGCGVITVKTKYGEKRIPNVYFVPGLKHNLLSVGQLLLKGYEVHFKNNACEIKDMNNKSLGMVRMTFNKMFPLRFYEDTSFSLITNSRDESLLWHLRYGHMNYDSLTHMYKQGMVRGLPNITKVDHVCEPCTLGKHTRDPFSHDKTWRALKKLEIVHSDDYLKEQGIHHQLTTRYTPQQNGVAERKNRTIVEMARSMLKAKRLSNTFWAEAVACATYLLNQATTKSLSDVTPQEAWTGFKPGISHLKIFGCLAYSHIPDQRRSKLDDKSEKTIFVGYSEHSKAYKLYNPQTRKVIVSRDVIFDEDKIWDGSDFTKDEIIPIIEEEVQDNDLTRGDNDHNEDSNIPTPNTLRSLRSKEPISSSSSEIQPRKTRSMRDLLDNTQRLDFDNTADFVLFADADPIDFHEACKEKKWRDAMDEEINSILKNDTWELVDLPKGHKPIGVKWIYKTKLNEKGEVDKYKARLVVKGSYAQRFGVDYKEVFAPVIRMETIRMVLALAAQNGWEVHQMDVKSAFLNGFLRENVFIEEPAGYIKKGQEYKVRGAWYSRIDGYFLNDGFNRCTCEHTLLEIECEVEFSIPHW
ncbi:hypothetical protein L6452_13741 [Arctium lappa]|uniref:Uncharacterized protein n=1 Tax=Arctium lappa TaxID=4217 RepID=A0ACB9CJ65_ARCLA|nr:hypothetical protein L6452_13741 [Arctium lappa]